MTLIYYKLHLLTCDTLLVGKVNLCSPDHISLLVHRTFNVSIPRHHIPTDEWDFEYGPAENDPEYGQSAQENNNEMVADDMTKKQNSDSGGKWVRRITGHRIGNKDGFLEFTVVGCVVHTFIKETNLPCAQIDSGKRNALLTWINPARPIFSRTHHSHTIKERSTFGSGGGCCRGEV